MLLRVVAVLAVAMVAGCLGRDAAGNPDPQGTEAEPTGRLGRQDGDAPGESFKLVADDADPTALEGITEFHWGLPTPAVGLVLETTWEFGDDNECVLMDAQRNGPGKGPSDLYIRQYGSGYGWGMSSGGDLAAVHAGPVDTRTSSDGGGGSASRMQGTISGAVKTTWLLASVEPGEMSFLKDGLAAGFSISCADPFSLVSASQGTVALLVDESNLAGGAGASVFIAGSANVGDAASGTVSAPIGHAACGSFGAHAARVNARLPSGDQLWLHQPSHAISLGPNFFLVDDGPGPYGFDVDRAGAYFEAFWCAAWGIDGPLDLNVNRLQSNPVDLPF